MSHILDSMEHFDRYTSLSDERTLSLLCSIRASGGSCTTMELREIVPNYPTLRERLEWMSEDGLIEIHRIYAPVKRTDVSLTERGKKVVSALQFDYSSISMRYADPVLRKLSKGEKVHYAELLKCVSNQRTLEKLLPELEKEGLLVCGAEETSYRSKFAVATEDGVRVGRGFQKAYRLIRGSQA